MYVHVSNDVEWSIAGYRPMTVACRAVMSIDVDGPMVQPGAYHRREGL